MRLLNITASGFRDRYNQDPAVVGCLTLNLLVYQPTQTTPHGQQQQFLQGLRHLQVETCLKTSSGVFLLAGSECKRCISTLSTLPPAGRWENRLKNALEAAMQVSARQASLSACYTGANMTGAEVTTQHETEGACRCVRGW